MSEKSQLGLFSGAVDNHRVRPHPQDPWDEKLSRKLPARLHLGTSSWNFPGWRGILYERDAAVKDLSRHGLRAYAQREWLRCVGVDRGYYNAVPVEDWELYRDQVPANFRFMVKALQRVLMPWLDDRGHPSTVGRGENASFLDAQMIKDLLLSPASSVLQEMLGPVLFQFAPMSAEAVGGSVQFCEKLDRFLGQLPNHIHYVVELRTPGLFTRRYLSTLSRHNASHGAVVHPAMTSFERQVIALQGEGAPLRLIRWMLHADETFESAKARYTPFDQLVDEDLDHRYAVARAMKIWLEKDGDSELFCILNNKAEGSSPRSLKALAQLLLELSTTSSSGDA